MSTSLPPIEISSANYNANSADLLSRKLPNEHSTLRGSELSKLFAESRNATERLTQFRVLHKKDSLNRKSTECRAAPVQSGSQLIESSLKSLRGKKENDNHNRQKRIFRTAPHSDPGATVTANIHVKFIISILSSVERKLFAPARLTRMERQSRQSTHPRRWSYWEANECFNNY